MYTPGVQVLFAGEFLLLLLGVSLFPVLYMYKRRAQPGIQQDQVVVHEKMRGAQERSRGKSLLYRDPG